MNPRQRWNQRHRARYNELQRGNNRFRQAVTKLNSTNHRQRWTFAHDLAALVMPHVRAALITGRTYAAIANRVRKFRFDTTAGGRSLALPVAHTVGDLSAKG